MINRVFSAVIKRLGFLIAWPSDAECRRNISQKFFQLHIPGVPSVCGALDGTLIPITAPAIDELQYVDRHQGHSINAMAVAGLISDLNNCKKNLKVQICIFTVSAADGQEVCMIVAY